MKHFPTMFPTDLASETLTFGRPSNKFVIISGKGVFPLWPLSERLFVLIGNYVESRPSAIT